ncbi:PREDICTED: polyamine-modulated factor 1-binding protein 1-like isoform X3 [Ipomoea nil]|uniref:polyamine-modulated factor 1-binding protein 1-like isoform X3 n=1 Tax=Ipomoea nil TaxID=35883 RepID=UPI000901ECDB|nr:PREDICTED: polyamine-modulated factor 1-binding protein 1-like isoform X3 [Ipomoea nil]
MSLADRPPSSSSALRNVDPLPKDLNEKKQNFRRNVVSLAAELKDMRLQLHSKDQSFARETLTRQEAENKANKMEEELNRLHKIVEEKDLQLEASTSTVEKYLSDVDDRLGEQLDLLQKDPQVSNSSQMQLKDEVSRIENHFRQELSQMRDEFKFMSSLWSLKTQELVSQLEKCRRADQQMKLKTKMLESQLEKHRRTGQQLKLKAKQLESQLEKHQIAEQQLKKRVLELEFCLHKMGGQHEAIKEIRDQLASKNGGQSSNENQNFWDKSGFKIVASISMVVLVLFTKR